MPLKVLVSQGLYHVVTLDEPMFPSARGREPKRHGNSVNTRAGVSAGLSQTGAGSLGRGCHHLGTRCRVGGQCGGDTAPTSPDSGPDRQLITASPRWRLGPGGKLSSQRPRSVDILSHWREGQGQKQTSCLCCCGRHKRHGRLPISRVV